MHTRNHLPLHDTPFKDPFRGMFADDIAASIDKPRPHPSPQRKQGNAGGLTVLGRGFPRSRVGLVWERGGALPRPIKALSVRDGICPVRFAIPRLPPGAFIEAWCFSLSKPAA